jgi:hypothetical protein
MSSNYYGDLSIREFKKRLRCDPDLEPGPTPTRHCLDSYRCDKFVLSTKIYQQLRAGDSLEMALMHTLESRRMQESVKNLLVSSFFVRAAVHRTLSELLHDIKLLEERVSQDIHDGVDEMNECLYGGQRAVDRSRDNLLRAGWDYSCITIDLIVLNAQRLLLGRTIRETKQQLKHEQNTVSKRNARNGRGTDADTQTTK